jgi:hypothetical protein
MLLNSELEKIRKETVVIGFKTVFRYLPGRNEKSARDSQNRHIGIPKTTFFLHSEGLRTCKLVRISKSVFHEHRSFSYIILVRM